MLNARRREIDILRDQEIAEKARLQGLDPSDEHEVLLARPFSAMYPFVVAKKEGAYRARENCERALPNTPLARRGQRMSSYAVSHIQHCCLCGATELLSGEHKIKASALRAEFGQQGMVIGRPGESYRLAQGSNSKAFHFSARICEDCNNARTQPADLAFDAFNAHAQALARRGLEPAQVLDDPRFRAIHGPQYLNVFRYFAKLMCCHLAEIGAPPLAAVADFAIGASDMNCVLLGVDRDVAFRRLQETLPTTRYAAHGGLVVLGDATSHAPTSFYSTLTLGPVRYRYQIRLNETGQLLLALEHPDFYSWCEHQVHAAFENPISEDDRELLGLSPPTRD